MEIQTSVYDLTDKIKLKNVLPVVDKAKICIRLQTKVITQIMRVLFYKCHKSNINFNFPIWRSNASYLQSVSFQQVLVDRKGARKFSNFKLYFLAAFC